MKRCILFFLKWPEPGKAKTRLAASIGDEAAVAMARAMAEDMLDALKRVEDADIIVCFSPKERADDMKSWLGEDHKYLAQSGPNLGRRMKNAFISTFQNGYDQAVLVGSDIPDVTDEDVRQAFVHLENKKSCAIGPSRDGGYWLIGFDARGSLGEVFIDMEWGRTDVLEQTVRRLEFDERNLIFVTKRTDVDTLADLQSVLDQGGLRASAKTLKLAKKLPELV